MATKIKYFRFFVLYQLQIEKADLDNGEGLNFFFFLNLKINNEKKKINLSCSMSMIAYMPMVVTLVCMSRFGDILYILQKLSKQHA